jgi:hypothetical protein
MSSIGFPKKWRESKRRQYNKKQFMAAGKR